MTGTSIWRTSIVTLSFQYPYLLHALFSLSALHLVFLYSTQDISLARKYTHLATLHHMKCISSYRLEIQNLTSQNSDACWACASILGLHAWTKPGGQGADLFFPNSDHGSVPWYKLHRGGVEVLKSSFHWVENGALRELIRPLMVLRVVFMPEIPFESLCGVETKLDVVAECWESDILSHDQLVLDETLQTLRNLFSLLAHISTKSREQLEASISSCVATLSWTALVPPRFCDMVDEKVPQALVVVAVYCILLKRLEKVWWIKGKAESLLGAVEKELIATYWDKWLRWPRDEVYGIQDDLTSLV